MAARRKKAEDDHICPAVESYLLTYADMITSLLIFFIVMFAMGQLDLAKFEKFKNGIAQSGSTPIDDGLLENGEGIFEQAIIRPELIDSPDDNDGPGGTSGLDRQRFEETQREVSDRLEEIAERIDIGTDVKFRVETRGLVITIVSDQVLFSAGSSGLTDQGNVIVDAIGQSIAQLPNRITIEGHTDSIPIHTSQFPSNWELSVNRATTVLRSLVDRWGLDSHRMSAAGYADQRPIASNETADGRAANRRVEVVINNTDDETPSFGEG